MGCFKVVPMIGQLTLVIYAMFFIGCNNDQHYIYDTRADFERLAKLQGKTLVILYFGHNESALLNSDSLDASFANIVNKELKTKLMAKFSHLFKIVDLSKASDTAMVANHVPNNEQQLSKIIKKEGADGGIIVVSAFGYKMKSASGAIWSMLESLIPKNSKKSYRAVLGPSEVESYYFASRMYILDNEGKIVWNYGGKESVFPSVDFSLKEFARSFAGMDPSSEKVASEMVEAGIYFTDFSAWLIEQDLKKSTQKNYFSDYPEERRNKRISVYPDTDNERNPIVAWDSLEFAEYNVLKAAPEKSTDSKMASD